MRRLVGYGAAGAIAFVASCSAEVTRADLDEALLEAEGELTPTEASCVVDELVAIYGIDELQDELNRESTTEEFGMNRANSHLRCGATDAYEESISGSLITDGATEEQASCTTSAFVSSLDDRDVAHLETGAEWDGEPIYDKWIDALEACGLWP